MKLGNIIPVALSSSFKITLLCYVIYISLWIKNRKTKDKINQTKSWFFEKIKKIDKPLAILTKEKIERNQISKIIIAKGVITMDTTEIQKNIRSYYEQLYS